MPSYYTSTARRPFYARMWSLRQRKLHKAAQAIGEPTLPKGTTILWSACLVGAVICVMVRG